MKIGKVSESVLKRSILKEIKNTKEEILIGAGVGEDCAVLALKEGEVVITISVKDESVTESIKIKVNAPVVEPEPQPEPEPIAPSDGGCKSATSILYLSLALLAFALIRRKIK